MFLFPCDAMQVSNQGELVLGSRDGVRREGNGEDAREWRDGRGISLRGRHVLQLGGRRAPFTGCYLKPD